MDESYHLSEWADYLGDTGRDASSPPPQDPLFVDPACNDFRLRLGSPAINAGSAMPSRTTDLCGTSLDPTPDIGAIECGTGTAFCSDDIEADNLCKC